MGLTWLRDAPPTSQNRCSLYTAVDLTAKPTPLKGCEQWLVVGRRQKVQVDYPDLNDVQATEKTRLSTTLAKLTMNTQFPFGFDVNIRVDWNDAEVSSVAPKLWIRMPSWLDSPMQIKFNDHLMGLGQPGSYIEIDRIWKQRDTISFVLPRVYKLSRYEGVDQIPGYEGKRYALLLGPIVLACVGPMDLQGTTVLPVPPSQVPDWLLPDASGTPLHFGIRGAPQFRFKPLWAVRDGEKFTTYPIFGGTFGSDFYV